MPRIMQLINKPRKQKLKKNKLKLNKNPQKKAVCLKILTISPKKPNSANRRVARVKIAQTSDVVWVKIPGENHNLQQHSTILIKGGRSRDLIGVKLKAIRGKYDLLGVSKRKTSRSKYGVKSF